eukprot:9825009-Ditylum_brightwellii.AAC.1
MTTGHPGSEPHGHVHSMHTDLVQQTGLARQLKLLEGHLRPGQWCISLQKEKCGLADESCCWWEPQDFLLK